jgi:NAD(P)-dependent dehydrogenase (short-subunit alcohol dehydrogenase family)
LLLVWDLVWGNFSPRAPPLSVPNWKRNALADVTARFGRVDVLVNNAGIVRDRREQGPWRER